MKSEESNFINEEIVYQKASILENQLFNQTVKWVKQVNHAYVGINTKK